MMSTMNEKNKVIAIETSGHIGSVAAACGDNFLQEKEFSAPLRHTTELMPKLDELCKELNWKPADIDQIYVSGGPGSFTGIRIAITCAKTIAYALKTPVVVVPSIDAQTLNADQASQETAEEIRYVAVVLEAGRGQVFTAVYEKIQAEPDDSSDADYVPGYRTLIDRQLMTPAELLEKAPRPLHILGEGINYHRQKLIADQVILLDKKYAQPHASHVFRCGQLRARAGLFLGSDGQPTIEGVTPIYMRRPEAVEKWEERQGKS